MSSSAFPTLLRTGAVSLQRNQKYEVTHPIDRQSASSHSPGFWFVPNPAEESPIGSGQISCHSSSAYYQISHAGRILRPFLSIYWTSLQVLRYLPCLLKGADLYPLATNGDSPPRSRLSSWIVPAALRVGTSYQVCPLADPTGHILPLELSQDAKDWKPAQASRLGQAINLLSRPPSHRIVPRSS